MLLFFTLDNFIHKENAENKSKKKEKVSDKFLLSTEKSNWLTLL